MTKQSFKPIDPKPDFPKLEEEVLKFWEENQVFEKTLRQTKDGEHFVFFEGPPTANGKPGIHHIEARAFKDLIPRFQTMRGKFVLRKGGWDTHGLPVELEVEKKLGISGKKQIESIKDNVRDSIIEFNRLCKESVWQYKEEWERMTRRMGYWIDLDNPYVTYHNSYIESVWAILKKVWDKKLIYLGHKVVPYCYRCGTALSSHEVAQGYQNVWDDSVYVKFKLKNQENTYILSWTTTPWTLPGNVALAVGKDIGYVKVLLVKSVDDNGSTIEQLLKNKPKTAEVGPITEGTIPTKFFLKEEYVIFAKERYEDIKKLSEKEGYSLKENTVEEILGSKLVGLEYERLFDIGPLKSDKSYKVYPADFVTTTDGTGVVHTAVMYGEDDYELGTQIGLPKFHTVDETGHFTADVPELGGAPVKHKETDKRIFEYLQARNLLFKKEKYQHEYPHCWRCSTPLLYYARDSWFIAMSKLRDQLKVNNEKINWVPEYIKEGRFGEWLDGVKDWAISRERYWGTPLPIWQCEECKEPVIVGSMADLKLDKNTIYIMRHGRCENNDLRLNDCWPDTKKYALTSVGRQQTQEGAKILKQTGGVDLIFSSDITRCKETAEIIGKELGVEVQFDPRLREVDCGTYNGKTYEEIWKNFSFEDRWTKAPAGGETNTQVQARMLDFLREVNAKYSDKRILIIGHGDPIKLVQQHLGVNFEYPSYGRPYQIHPEVTDLHRPYIDDVVLKCDKCGQNAKRIPAVLDVWFDSGAMPYAQWHYPFENQSAIDQHYQFPADYISEAIDQTRGWFYTLLAISTLLDLGPAYKNVINLGHLLDSKGQKMSKSKGNVLDPFALMDKFGVDSLRWYMYSVNQPGDSKLFGERDAELVLRKNFVVLWNVFNYFVTYANEAGWEPTLKGRPKLDNVLDQWIVAKTQELVNLVTERLEGYDPFHASRAIEEYIQELSTWYLRRSRGRKDTHFFGTLRHCLLTLAKLLAPFTPFISEMIWQNLNRNMEVSSVHLAKWPEQVELTSEEQEVLKQMSAVRSFVEQGHAIRKTANIKLRQPLASVSYRLKEKLSEDFEQILADELNVKAVIFGTELKFDTTITPELRQEGLARELERAVQEMRKKLGFKVGQAVKLGYNTEDKELKAAFALIDTKKTYINMVEDEASIEQGEDIDIEGKQAKIKLKSNE